MKKIWFLGAALAGAMSLAGAANAAVYTSQLEYTNATTKAGPFGQVTLTELDANDVKVEVSLYSPLTAFLNTGGPHEPFVFNLTGNYQVTLDADASGQSFTNPQYDTNGTTTSPNFTSTPFGNFTNVINCCSGGNGSGNSSLPPLIFTVHDASGITFAGLGATFDSTTGKLLTTGTGDHFVSNAGGWWFAADVTDGTNTFNVAARDAFGVPEPATWAMMLVGFGGLGALLRRRRTALAVA